LLSSDPDKTSNDDLDHEGNPFRTLPVKPKAPEKEGEAVGPDPLNDYQCIIVGDVSPEHMTLEERKRLEKYVSDHGGTLVIVAGKRFMPRAFQQSARPLAPAPDKKDDKKDDADPLLKMLPIKNPREIRRREEAFPITLTRLGKETPMMRIKLETSDLDWHELPAHYWAVVGEAKPGAVVLGYFRDPDIKFDEKDRETIEDKMSRSSALVVRQPYGNGQVLYVGVDSTWRWRYR